MDHKHVSPDIFHQSFNLATLLTFTAAWMVLGMGLVRSGLEDSSALKLAIVVFLLVSLWLPVFAIHIGKRYWLEAGTAAATIGMVFPILGLWMGVAAVWVAGGVLVALAIYLARHSPGRDGRLFWITMLGAPLLAVVLLSLGSADRFFLPENMSAGSAQSDSYFHIALATMISNFQMPSIGADGLELTKYHFGSHFVAGGMAKAAHARMSEVYVYWAAIALRVQLIWGMLWCSLLLLSTRPHVAPVRTRVFLLIALVGMTSSFFNSESFLLALAIFLGSVPLISRHLTQIEVPRFQLWLQFLIILATAFICATAKVSLGYFVAVLLLYAAYEDRRNIARVVVTLFGLGTLAICTIALLHPSDVSLASAGLGILVASYLQYTTPTTLVSFLLPLALLLLQFVRLERLSKTEDVRGGSLGFHMAYSRYASVSDFLQHLRTLPGEWQVLAVSLAACVLVVVTLPIGSNAAYFSAVLLFMSFAMAPAGLFQLCGALSKYKAFKAVELLMAFMLVVHLLVFALQFKAQVERVAVCETCPPATDTTPPRQQIQNSLRTHGTVWSVARERWAPTPWAALIRDVEGFASPQAGTMVFVPPANTAFWQRLKPGSPYWCISPQLMIPAETGIPMLRGIAPDGYEPKCMPPGLVWYGFGRQQDAHRTGDFDDQRLCAMVVAKGFNRLYILNSIDNLRDNRKLTCP
ncbi:hypothetical protein [Hydrogenophaga sp. BPS33]|uniref:hypothetical protein n=1 Tax=Hydrogenophaga sp. BPS33 TaxID=2651974 RepID=UPI00131F534A|nr:hypothetical protein [Hydrogenophaga sp. BPS33]QHE83737.1 hypothetical protein F9K07_01995 [Hydrogenophaga sp. BPS33]